MLLKSGIISYIMRQSACLVIYQIKVYRYGSIACDKLNQSLSSVVWCPVLVKLRRIFPYSSVLTYILRAQKNLIATFLSTHNICLGREIKNSYFGMHS